MRKYCNATYHFLLPTILSDTDSIWYVVNDLGDFFFLYSNKWKTPEAVLFNLAEITRYLLTIIASKICELSIFVPYCKLQGP